MKQADGEKKISKSRRFLSPLDPDAVADYLSESGKCVLVMRRTRHEGSIFSVKSGSSEANPRGDSLRSLFLGCLIVQAIFGRLVR